MKNIITISLLLSIGFMVSCNNIESTSTKSTPEELAKGFELLENNCFSCHSPKGSTGNRIAPPMIAIKKHYVTKGISKEEFTKNLIAFINNPNKDISKMPEALNRFGLMPKMGFGEEQITNIAHYIYESGIEKSDWFEKHYEEEKKKYSAFKTELSPIEKGKKLALQTKSILGKNLLNAIKNKGTEGALEFCSDKAFHLTDSMPIELNAHIKRVSDKNRNPKNKANKSELAYIIKSKELLITGKKIKPQITEINNKLVGYYPIMTNTMCMQCHGEVKTEILPNTLTIIKSLYPTDKAINYKTDELRGIWVVEMDKK